MPSEESEESEESERKKRIKRKKAGIEYRSFNLVSRLFMINNMIFLSLIVLTYDLNKQRLYKKKFYKEIEAVLNSRKQSLIKENNIFQTTVTMDVIEKNDKNSDVRLKIERSHELWKTTNSVSGLKNLEFCGDVDEVKDGEVIATTPAK